VSLNQRVPGSSPGAPTKQPVVFAVFSWSTSAPFAVIVRQRFQLGSKMRARESSKQRAQPRSRNLVARTMMPVITLGARQQGRARRDPRIRSPSRAAVIAFRIAGHDSCPRVILADVAILPARGSGADTPSWRRAIHSARQRRTGSVQSLRVVRMGLTSQRSRAST
jgi:hypothetical protein